jgi:N-acetylmuramoyl-L-alanine amidase
MTTKKCFYIGAGHSNTDPGATTKDNSFTEAQLVTELRNLVVANMRAKGASVVTDGEGNINQPLSEAIKLANNCLLARIELHLNAFNSPNAAGVECLSLEKQRPLAQKLAQAIAKEMDIPLRGKEGGWKPDDAGHLPRLAFCREANGIIVECFFLTNPEELKKYLNRKDKVATTIAETLWANSTN